MEKIYYLDNAATTKVFDEEYDVICLAEHVYICTGKMWISTHPSTGMSLRVHQRITTVWKQSDEGFRCHHIHISNPYSEMEPSDVGFPEKWVNFPENTYKNK